MLDLSVWAPQGKFSFFLYLWHIDFSYNRLSCAFPSTQFVLLAAADWSGEMGKYQSLSKCYKKKCVLNIMASSVLSIFAIISAAFWRVIVKTN